MKKLIEDCFESFHKLDEIKNGDYSHNEVWDAVADTQDYLCELLDGGWDEMEDTIKNLKSEIRASTGYEFGSEYFLPLERAFAESQVRRVAELAELKALAQDYSNRARDLFSRGDKDAIASAKAYENRASELQAIIDKRKGVLDGS